MDSPAGAYMPRPKPKMISIIKKNRKSTEKDMNSRENKMITEPVIMTLLGPNREQSKPDPRYEITDPRDDMPNNRPTELVDKKNDTCIAGARAGMINVEDILQNHVKKRTVSVT
jgi:hypothetical protein